MATAILLLCLSLCGQVTWGDVARCSQSLTQTRVQQIKADLAVIIQGVGIPQALRLSFHDCLDGCDGCMNFNDLDNQGKFVNTFNALNNLYASKNYAADISRADLFALAGIVAVEQGVILNNNNCVAGSSQCTTMPTPNIEFRYCRTDCPTSPITTIDQAFPAATFNHAQVMSFFSAKFGLTEQQVTALLGVHTVGSANLSPVGVGFSGKWKQDVINGVNASNMFNNGYYKNLVDPTINWGHNLNAQGNWQWDGMQNGAKKSFMLDADVSLLLDIQVTGPNGLSSCSFTAGTQQSPNTPISLTKCNPASTNSLVMTYAQNPNMWLQDFTIAYQIMISNGNPNLQLPQNTGGNSSLKNGAWSGWSSWSNCVASGSGNSQQRTRTCTNPSPSTKIKYQNVEVRIGTTNVTSVGKPLTINQPCGPAQSHQVYGPANYTYNCGLSGNYITVQKLVTTPETYLDINEIRLYGFLNSSP